MTTEPGSRAGRIAALALGVALVSSHATLSAHRLDECLQAARIGIVPGQVELEVSLTPGVEVFDSFAGQVDRNADGALSNEEQAAFVALVLESIELTHDAQAVALTDVTSSFPALESLQRGEGTIQVRAMATLREPQSSGTHRISFRNRLRPDVSVYLANVLAPEDDRVAITGLRRAVDQHELAIDYVVHPSRSSSFVWLLGGVATALMVLLAAGGRWTR